MKKLINDILGRIGYQITKKENIDNVTTDNFEFIIQKELLLKFKNNISNIIIFDVGAYIGEVSLIYNNIFDNPKIFSFEPFQESFLKLQENLKYYSNITPVNLAISDTDNILHFHSNSFAPTNSILPSDSNSDIIWRKDVLNTKEKIQVNSTTIDAYLEKNDFETIDILKLDVQGAEYKVLLGGEKAFKEKRIGLLYMEIITMPTYIGQKDIDEIISLLKSYEYFLYDLYNFSYTESGQLRQVDAIFIPKQIL